MSAKKRSEKLTAADGRRHSTSPRFLQLQRENERLEGEIEQLRRDLAERDRQVADAEKQIAELEKQLALRKRNSTNSSKPPSSDGLAGDQRERGGKGKGKDKRKRKPGGQPGHPGHHRRLVPVSEVNALKTMLPCQCQHCGVALSQDRNQITTEGEPRRHQVTELPPVKAHITEYQFPKVICPDCGKATQQALPEELARHFGSRLTALIAYLTVVCRMPRRVVESMLTDVLGTEVSLGSTQKAWEETSQAVEKPCQELQQGLTAQAVLNVDETGWRTNGDKRWLWVLVASRFAFYVVASSRGADVLVALLGAVFRGILCSDRWVVYLSYHCQGKMQLCWAHLKRNILGAADGARTPSSRKFCRDMLAIVARMFRLWHNYRGNLRDRRGNPKPITTRQELIEKSLPLQKKLFALAEQHLDDADPEVGKLAKALFTHCGRLFTFMEEEGVEPTNNSGERRLRPAVQWRKICFGNRSRTGEIATGRLLTVSQTCAMQRRHLLGYLTDAVDRHRRRLPAPSLLTPTT